MRGFADFAVPPEDKEEDEDCVISDIYGVKLRKLPSRLARFVNFLRKYAENLRRVLSCIALFSAYMVERSSFPSR